MSNTYPNKVAIEPHPESSTLYYVALSNTLSSNVTKILCDNKVNAIKLKNTIVKLCTFVLKNVKD